MKRLLLSFIIILFPIALVAQAPQKVSYQGMVLKNGNIPVSNGNVDIRLSVLQGSQTGDVVYCETHRTTTNANGLFSVLLGTGHVESANDFSTIEWGRGPFYLKSEIAPDGDRSYTIFSSNQLVSVPYALYANTSLHIIGFTDSLLQVKTMLRDSIASVRNSINFQLDATIHFYDSVIQRLRKVIVYRLIDSTQVDTVPEPVLDTSQDAVLSGTFSISPEKSVRGAAGNLQYQPSTGTWRFADHQYDYLCTDNANVSSTYDGWIDLFGWGTSGWQSGAIAYQPWSTSTTNTDYYPGSSSYNDLTRNNANADWGRYNSISNGGNQPGLWRTLTVDEWDYLLNYRPVSDRYAKANIAGIVGLIIFPDEYSHPAGVSYPQRCNERSAPYTTNNYSLANWQRMENAGCLFLPAAGYRTGNTTTACNSGYGYYWTSTHDENAVIFANSSNNSMISSANRSYGCAVRLFLDAVDNEEISESDTTQDAPLTIDRGSGQLPAPFSVAKNHTVIFSLGNLQHKASEGIWRFAPQQYDYIGEGGNVVAAECRDTSSQWIDLFGWGTSNWDGGARCYQPYATATTTDYYYVGGFANNDLTGISCQADWGVHNPIINGGNEAGKWRTMTHNEWQYLLFTRKTFYDGVQGDNRFCKAQVAGVCGIIIFPDIYWPPSGVKEPIQINNYATGYSYNTYSASEWAALEAEGCAFLPAAGYRSGVTVNEIGTNGYYWASDNYRENEAFELCFTRHSVMESKSSSFNGGALHSVRHRGFSVRLVRDDHIPEMDSDIFVPTPIDTTTLVPEKIEGQLDSAFSVAEGKIVHFSKGNLQYLGSGNKWRFAENQYDYIGDQEGNTTLVSKRATNTEWIDLFSWGTSGWNSGAYTYQPYTIFISNAYSSHYYPGIDYHNDLTGECAYADWGQYNAISNGGNKPRLWRTLGLEEWRYMLFHRPTSTVGSTANARFVKATIGDVEGLIIFPDHYVHPENIALPQSINAATGSAFTTNVYTKAEWRNMEKAGCVFLPAAGYRGTGSTIHGVKTTGYYWSSTHLDFETAYNLSFGTSDSGRVTTHYSNYRGFGASVRLVR